VGQSGSRDETRSRVKRLRARVCRDRNRETGPRRPCRRRRRQRRRFFYLVVHVAPNERRRRPFPETRKPVNGVPVSYFPDQ